MNPETLSHCKVQLQIKSKRLKRKSLKAIVKCKFTFITSSNITIHYAKEILLQAKNFKNNINQLNRFDYEQRD